MNMTTTQTRKDALDEIVALAERHAITNNDIAAARAGLRAPTARADQQKGILSRLFSYIGGILIFCGFGVFVAMHWMDFSSAFRVIITLGSGFCFFVAAVACARRKDVFSWSGPLFLVAAFFETGGLGVMLAEYGSGNDWHHAALFISGVMGVQYAVTYASIRHSVLAFFALLFGGCFAATAMHMIDIPETLIGIAVGSSYLCLATALGNTLSTRQAGFWHLLGAFMLLSSFFEEVRDTSYEITFVGLGALLVYLSIVVRSRALLIISTLAMIGYIGDYAFDVFAHNGLFPLGLIVAGGVFMGLGALAMRIDRRFIRQQG